MDLYRTVLNRIKAKEREIRCSMMTSELTEESEPIESKKEEDPKATIPASSEPLKEEEAPKSEEGEEKSDVAEDNE